MCVSKLDFILLAHVLLDTGVCTKFMVAVKFINIHTP